MNEPLDLIQQTCEAGKLAFEQGDYRQSIQYLEQAIGQLAPQSKLAGEAQIWLVTAYEAAGQNTQAIALCRQATQHPDFSTRKQAKRLLYILEAPKLRSHPEWLTEIPDLTALSDRDHATDRSVSKFGAVTPPSPPEPTLTSFVLEPIAANREQTQDNQFIWVALLGILFTIGGLIWLS